MSFRNVHLKALWEKNKNKEVAGGTMEGMDRSGGEMRDGGTLRKH